MLVFSELRVFFKNNKHAFKQDMFLNVIEKI